MIVSSTEPEIQFVIKVRDIIVRSPLETDSAASGKIAAGMFVIKVTTPQLTNFSCPS